MHTALHISEILEEICTFVPQESLANLIRTCRAFEEPSRRELWKKLVWLDVLVGLLPESTWAKDSHGRETFHHHPSAQDWERMRRYTSCITEVELDIMPPSMFNQKYTSLNSQRLLLLISLVPPESLSPMFPRLKTIRCDTLNRADAIVNCNTQVFRWVNGPSVTHLRLDFYADEWSHDRTIEFVSSLSTLYPRATDVRIFIDTFYFHREELVPAIFESLFNSVRDWKHLVRGTFQTPDVATFEHLSRLQSLTSFHLDVRTPQVPARLHQANLPANPFPALTYMGLSSRSVHQLDEWLHPFHLSPRDLICHVENPFIRSTSDLHDLCSWISSHFCNRSLEVIELRAEHALEFDGHGPWMRPLFTFSHLRRVLLSRFVMNFINDDVLTELASSWPLLEWLDLSRTVETFRKDEVIILPTFRGLFSLVKHCPRLRVLFIVFDTRDSTWVDPRNPYNGVCNYQMMALNLGNSPLDDRGRVARILGAVYPRLEEFYFRSSEEVVTVKLHEANSQVEVV